MLTTRGALRAFGALLACALASAPVVLPAQIPATASPGASKPEASTTLPGATAPGPIFPIPPAVERPLDEEAGERLFVKRFKLVGMSDRPKPGIVAEELDALVEELRVQRQGLDKVDETGFTVEEKTEIAAFMKEVVSNRDLDYMGPEYEALIDRLRELKGERDAGMTVGQMQQIAGAVTEYYRSAGYVLAQAYIPAQEVEEGVVQIAVLEGTLGNVLVEGNKSYSSELLAAPFQDLIDAPVTADGVESAILTASDYPGLSVFGVFRPGREVGETDLVLRVQDERPWDVSVRYDNHGTRFSGKNRLLVEGTLNNPTGAGDRLFGSVLRQVNPGNSNYGEIRYERPVLTPGFYVGSAYSRNPFNVGAELKDSLISGESTVLEVYGDKSMLRSRQNNAALRVGWRRVEELTKVAKVPVGEDQLSYLYSELRFDNIESEAKAINVGTAGVSVGLGDALGGNGSSTASGQAVPPRRQGGSGNFASNDFWLVEGTFSRFQQITDSISVLSRFEGQFTSSRLTSYNQYTIGGPTNVRAYDVTEFLVDKAFFASMEWTFDAPFIAEQQFHENLKWGDVLKVSFFADYAFGRLNDPTNSDVGADLVNINVGGIGAGVSFNLPGQALGRVQYAHPVGRRVPGDPGDRDSGKWWFDFTYQF